MRKFICGKRKELKVGIEVFEKDFETILMNVSIRLDHTISSASITFSPDFCFIFLGKLVIIAIIPTNTKNIDPLVSPRKIRSPQIMNASLEENCIENI